VVAWCVRGDCRSKQGVASLFLSVCGELYLYSICKAGQQDTLEVLPAKRMCFWWHYEW
jgi:hypothetical protein